MRQVCSRRKFLRSAVALPALGAANAHAAPVVAGGNARAVAEACVDVLPATELGVRPSGVDDTAALRAALRVAAERGRALLLPSEGLMVGGLEADFPVRVVGGELTCRAGARHLLAVRGAPVHLQGVRLNGAGQVAGGGRDGLVVARGAPRVRVRDCVFEGADGNCLALFDSTGNISGNRFARARRAGIFTLDCRNLNITENEITHCGNGGILVWQSRKRADGALIARNRVAHIRADLGGEGQNGNGINVFRGGDVQVVDNVVEHCAFTAVRAHSADNVIIARNRCRDLGEVSIFVEFAFQGAVVADNVVEDASAGISITNFNDDGRLATVSGNILRRMISRIPSRDVLGYGIFAEADTTISGNVVEEAGTAGLWLGWGRYLRNVVAQANVVRRAPVGAAVSVVAGSGAAILAANVFEGVEGGVVGYDHARRATGELLGATTPAHLTLHANRVL